MQFKNLTFKHSSILKCLIKFSVYFQKLEFCKKNKQKKKKKRWKQANRVAKIYLYRISKVVRIFEALDDFKFLLKNNSSHQFSAKSFYEKTAFFDICF